jgi:hypothetical protein
MINATMCFLRNKQKTLLLYRNKGEGDIHHGWYVPPGGRTERGERGIDCMVREFREETGLILINPKLRVIATFYNQGRILGGKENPEEYLNEFNNVGEICNVVDAFFYTNSIDKLSFTSVYECCEGTRCIRIPFDVQNKKEFSSEDLQESFNINFARDNIRNGGLKPSNYFPESFDVCSYFSDKLPEQSRNLAVKAADSVEEIKKRTGLQSHEQLRDYVKGKLKEQDEMWDKQWTELYTEGAIFRIAGGGRYSKDCSHTFETVRTYLPTGGTMGPNQYILSRIHNSNKFMTFDDREIPELTKLEDVQPLYNGKFRRGIIKATEEMAKREVAKHKNTNGKLWHQFYDTGAVFTHAGFNDTFESFGHFNLPNTERRTNNEVILARSYSNPVFVEFTPRDLGALELSSIIPRYTRKEGHTTYAPALTLD